MFTDGTGCVNAKYIDTVNFWGCSEQKKEVGYPVSANDTTVSSPNSPAVITLSAESGVVHTIFGMAFSYDNSPTNGRLSIESPPGVVVFGPIAVTKNGAGFIPFDHGKSSYPGDEMVVQLSSGGPGVRGSISLLGYERDLV